MVYVTSVEVNTKFVEKFTCKLNAMSSSTISVANARVPIFSMRVPRGVSTTFVCFCEDLRPELNSWQLKMFMYFSKN